MMTEIGAGDWLKQHILQEKRRKLLAKKPKKQRAKTEKRKRTEKMNRELAAKKREMWYAACRDAYYNHNVARCRFCGGVIVEFKDCEICHESSRGLGGGKRDDSKVFLGHRAGNRAQGGQSLEAYLAGKTKEQLLKNCGVGK